MGAVGTTKKIMQNNTEQKKWYQKTWAIVALSVLGILFITDIFSDEDPNKQNSVPVSSPIKDVPIENISAKELMAYYEQNEVRADEKYRDKKIQVTGVVGSIKKDFTDDIYITFKVDEYGISTVQCYLNDKNAASSLNIGDKISVTGKCTGLMMGIVTIKDSELSK